MSYEEKHNPNQSSVTMVLRRKLRKRAERLLQSMSRTVGAGLRSSVVEI